MVLAVVAAIGLGTGTASAATGDPGDTVVSYDFEPAVAADGVSQTVFANGGSADVVTSVVSAYGGSVQAVPSRANQGGAVRFPTFSASSTAPRAVVKIVNRTSTDVLAPGNRDFSWSADFNIDAETASHARGSTDNGDNLFQRGLFNDTQYKLDLDNHQPSCRLRGSTGATGAVRVTAPLTVVPSQWYHATCTRTGNQISIEVDAFDENGVVTQQWTRSATSKRGFGTLTWPKTGTPLSIGGKLTATGKPAGGSGDQFNGVVDNAVLQFQ
jgi:hypothetical protein